MAAWMRLLGYTTLLVLCTLHGTHAQNKAGCPNPRRNFKNGVARLRFRGRVAVFRCIPGFQLVGDQFITCIGRTWDKPQPVCVSSNCETPGAPSQGQVHKSPPGLVLFSCEPGYVLIGSPAAYCDGVAWNSSSPSCSVPYATPPKSCGFESDNLCYWSQNESQSLKWARSDLSIARVLPFDHTYSNSVIRGHFLYVQNLQPSEGNTWARLFSPIYSPDDAPGCFVFYYYSSDAAGTLKVSLRTENSSLVPEWTTSEETASWTRKEFYIPAINDSFQVVLQALPTASDDSYKLMAIDDVEITRACTQSASELTELPATGTELHITPEHDGTTRFPLTSFPGESTSVNPSAFHTSLPSSSGADVTGRISTPFPASFTSSALLRTLFATAGSAVAQMSTHTPNTFSLTDTMSTVPDVTAQASYTRTFMNRTTLLVFQESSTPGGKFSSSVPPTASSVKIISSRSRASSPFTTIISTMIMKRTPSLTKTSQSLSTTESSEEKSVRTLSSARVTSVKSPAASYYSSSRSAKTNQATVVSQIFSTAAVTAAPISESSTKISLIQSTKRKRLTTKVTAGAKSSTSAGAISTASTEDTSSTANTQRTSSAANTQRTSSNIKSTFLATMTETPSSAARSTETPRIKITSTEATSSASREDRSSATRTQKTSSSIESTFSATRPETPSSAARSTETPRMKITSTEATSSASPEDRSSATSTKKTSSIIKSTFSATRPETPSSARSMGTSRSTEATFPATSAKNRSKVPFSKPVRKFTKFERMTTGTPNYMSPIHMPKANSASAVPLVVAGGAVGALAVAALVLYVVCKRSPGGQQEKLIEQVADKAEEMKPLDEKCEPTEETSFLEDNEKLALTAQV